jgi:2'-5' RNA ligase
MKDNILRLFIAVNFSEDVKECLYQTVQELKNNTVKGSFTHKENLHLTLAFIGETKELQNVKLAMNRAVAETKTEPFSLTLESIGTFKRREGDIYWIGIKRIPVLPELNKALVRQLKPFVFNIDEGEFKAHLTLGRRIIVKKEFNVNKFADAISPITIDVDRISLMKSERVQGILTYTEIYNCKLGQ